MSDFSIAQGLANGKPLPRSNEFLSGALPPDNAFFRGVLTFIMEFSGILSPSQNQCAQFFSYPEASVMLGQQF